jgi:hypothetical protein
MSILQLGDVYARARSFLNDEEAANWTDYKLSKKLVHAFDELQMELVLAGIPIIQAFTAALTVPAFTTEDLTFDLSTIINYPTDILLPIWMKERQVGQLASDFVDMVETDFLPNIEKDIYLRYWCWYQNTILVMGALNPVQIQIRYQRFLPIPGVNTDSIVVPLGQVFLAPRIAAMVYDSVGNSGKNTSLTTLANSGLDKVVRMSIKTLQDIPAKRRPYHRGYDRNDVLRNF